MIKKDNKLNKDKTRVKKTPRINNSNEFRAQFIKRVVVYSIFGLLTIVLTLLVFYRAKGYTFTKNGQVEKRGIVLIDSAPVSAKIFLDGKEVDKTDSKLEVPEGDHIIRLEAEGYKTWQRSFAIGREKVIWFYYPFLIPETLSSELFITNQTPKKYSKLSPAGEVVSFSKSSQNNLEAINLELLNLKDEDPLKVAKPLIAPTTLFTRQASGGLGDISFVEWSPNGDSIYIQHNYDGKQELINLRVKNPLESQNLTRSLGTEVKELHYDSRSRVYALVGSEVAIYEPKTLAKEQVITSNASSFQVFSDDRFVFSQVTDSGSAIFVQEGQNIAVKVADLNTNDVASFDYKYIINRRTPYLAIANLNTKELQIFKNPLDTSLATSTSQPTAPLYLATFSELKSANIEDSPGNSSQPGMYIAMQLTNSELFIYDFEEESSFSYKLTLKEQPEKQLDVLSYSWLDSHRLQARTVEGDVYYFDYDGNYLNLIGNTAQEFSYFIKSKNRAFLVSNIESGSNQINLLNFKKK
ncbi:MAG: hypothetical protein QG623_218 [Patescibacteria group bacterium]|nr:hypothetical protein [Patescibacteria group bacterium]